MAETEPGTEAGWFTLRWRAGAVELLDQRQLPGEECYLLLREVDELAEAIETLAIRGAPAIGCAAAMGVALGAARSAATEIVDLVRDLETNVIPRLERTRPTAVNLFWALERMRAVLNRLAEEEGASVDSFRAGLVAEAEAILEADKLTCRRIGLAGAELVPDDATIAEYYCGVGSIGLPLLGRSKTIRFNERSPDGLAGLELGLAATLGCLDISL